MSSGICVSHHQLIPYEFHSCSAEMEGYPASTLTKAGSGVWKTPREKENHIATAVFLLPADKPFNFLALGLDVKEKDSNPKAFRIEISSDAKNWTAIAREDEFKGSVDGIYKWHFPLIQTRYIKILLLEHYPKDGLFYSTITALQIGINGVEKITVSSELDRLWTKENLFDRRADYGWATKINRGKQVEKIEIDLGAINHINQISLKSKDAINTYFPRKFFFEYSKNGDIWYTIHEEKDFVAEKDTWYSWSFLPTNMRFFRIIIEEGSTNEDGNLLSQIIEMELYAVSLIFDHTHPHEGITPYATTLHAGLIRLAKDGEDSKSVAVQGSDRRLRDATVSTKGIVRLAANGETSEFAVVQGNDKRLRDADETTKGIVQLAKDGESRKNLAVQSNDKRLREADESNAGIIKLCPPGETASRKAVQGDDPRLRISSEDFPGIVQLAKNGEDRANTAVQGNDDRLKIATTERKGIVQLAKNGETGEFLAVQANDKRLLDATANSKGIVRLARNGDQTPGNVVQGDDQRLQDASESNKGIIRLAKHQEKMAGLAIQADDPRLYDQREAKPHNHEYAPLLHHHNDHEGNLWIHGYKTNQVKDTNQPKDENSLIGARLVSATENSESTESISILAIVDSKIAGRSFGVLAHSPHTGLRGQATASGAGVEGHGRDCPGGKFFSRHDYALVAGSTNLEDGSQSSGKAFQSLGKSLFEGQVQIQPGKSGEESCIVYPFEANHHEPLGNGDLVCIDSNQDSTVKKCNQPYDRSILGVVTQNAVLTMGAPAHGSSVMVAVHGIVHVHVDPSFGEIKPGDLLTCSKTPGHAMKAKLDQIEKIGSIIGKALQSASGKTQKIKILLGKM